MRKVKPLTDAEVEAEDTLKRRIKEAVNASNLEPRRVTVVLISCLVTWISHYERGGSEKAIRAVLRTVKEYPILPKYFRRARPDLEGRHRPAADRGNGPAPVEAAAAAVEASHE